MTEKKTAYSRGAQLVGAVIFALLGLAALYVFVMFALPAPREHRESFHPTCSDKQLVETLADGGAVVECIQAIEQAGQAGEGRQVGRLSGSPGFYRTEKLILDGFAKAGLLVRTQELRVTVPVTEYCELLDEEGQPLPGITLYPFDPCGLLPTALPAKGIQGDLVVAESSDLRFLAGHNPARSIILTSLLSCDWKSLAAVGVQAVIVTEEDSQRSLALDPGMPLPWQGMVSQNEVAFPRFLVRGPLADYAGQKLTIRCKVTWQERPVRNLVGVLKGRDNASEALVVTAFYDSNSLVPDLAPGAEQSLSVAMLLELARAMGPYKGQLKRDVVFIATAGQMQSLAGVCRLMEPIETMTVGTADRRPLEDLIREEELQLGYARRGLEFVNDESRWTEEALAVFGDRWPQEDPDYREWLEKRIVTVLGEINLDFKARVMEHRLEYLRAGSPVYREGFDLATAGEGELKAKENRHPLLARFLEAQFFDNRSGNMLSNPFIQIVTRAEFREWNVRQRLRDMLERISAYHRQEIKELNDSIGIRELFAPYTRTLTLNLALNSGGSSAFKAEFKRSRADMSLLAGIESVGSMVEPQVGEIAQVLKEAIPVAGERPAFDVIHWGAIDALGTREQGNIHFYVEGRKIYLQSAVWTFMGKLGFSLVNNHFTAMKQGTPEDTLDDLETDVICKQLPVIGKAVLGIADGQVPFKSIPFDRRKCIITLHGTVYGNTGTGSTVPSHPMGVNTVVRAFNKEFGGIDAVEFRGLRLYPIRYYPILKANPYGEFRQRFNFNFLTYWQGSVKVDAARFDDQGRMRFFKNASASAQAVYPNEQFPTSSVLSANPAPAKPIHVSVFPCAPVGLYERNNPMTMNAFKGVTFLERLGLSAPENFRYGNLLSFLEPDFRFYLAFQDGASDNKELLVNRAFMLNVDPDQPLAPDEPDIYGKSYLAADSPNLVFAHQDAAASMLRTNEKRLNLQKRYGIADELMLSFHERGKEWLELARKCRDDNDTVGALLAAGKSLSYAINNHPVIRNKISHAVIGILWYLGLLVPFVFFFEKLVFGFTDIRKQLLANGVIFMVVFLLLRMFHPAFQMIRSSLMILLGFVIVLLTMLVTLMVSGKFKQNIKELRSKEGRIEGADINRGGVIGTAFMLGLNNMRRRKMRTGLTSVTLILLTFVMICFTSISTDLVDIEYPMGKSAWNGILFRKHNFLPIADSEINGLLQLYNRQYPMASNSWQVATLGEGMTKLDIIFDREYQVGDYLIQKRAMVSASIAMAWNEPLCSGIDRHLLTKRGWFPRPPTMRKDIEAAIKAGDRNKQLVILPDTVARELEITPEDVDAGEVELKVPGMAYPFIVQGIIDSHALSRMLGLDGRSILPYDVNALQSFGHSSAGIIIPDDVKRLDGSQVVLVNAHPPGGGEVKTVACGILFPQEPYRITEDGPLLPAVGYKDQRRLVMEFLERSGQSAYYAIDGVAYYGSRMRARTFEGMLELLIPILIAALTVFNTMRGSVYERRDEIYVYNAVGIAPNHVFFMFMAEACVYAVVGALLGYLLSQSTGRVLTALNLTGGMNMNYSSIETIYASLTIMGAVLISTLIPARDAARLASPADQQKWAVPVAQGDEMSFNLPFTFTQHDRIAVVSYFRRWLDSNGEGSSGPFFCAHPVLRLRKASGEERSGGLIPGVATTIWLKPFDLGVSQRIEIWLPTDPETGEYIANIRLVRMSGTSAAWSRTVKPFLGILRKQFLNWRAATEAEREEMFAEARKLLSVCAIEETAEMEGSAAG